MFVKNWIYVWLLAATMVIVLSGPARAADLLDADLDRPEMAAGLAQGRGDFPDTGDQQGGYWFRLAMKLGHHPRYRHWIARVLNANGGYLDRKVNAILLKKAWATTNIPNFHTVIPDLLRGGQPNPAGFERLAALGVRTVINLRMEDNTEVALVKRLGMVPVHLPMPDTNPPTPQQLERFLALTHLPGKIYIHCSAGIYRTGTMVAAFRIVNGMPLADALAEAKAHQFDPEWLDAPKEVAFLTQLAQDNR
jgi:protein tyrosine phosphatase (PTP) superfamily phosphohydrolase (DUF442 family)